MLDWLNNLILRVADVLLGWMLALDKNLVLFLVAIGTAAILVVVRLFTTNQDLLKRCSRDKKRLKQLIRQARQRKDKASVKRHKATITLIALKKMKSEGLPLLVALVPIVVLATWCFSRLGYHPPAAGQPIELTAYFPVPSVGKVMHIVPAPGLRADDGWVREVVPAKYQDQPHGRATWTIRAEASEQPYDVQIRLGDRTEHCRLLVGQRTYEPPVTYFPDQQACAEVKMEEVKLFGLVPGIDWLLLPPWLVAYLIIAVLFFPIVKLVLRIY